MGQVSVDAARGRPREPRAPLSAVVQSQERWLLVLMRPLLDAHVRWRTVAGIGAILSLLVLLSGLNVINSFVGREFFTAISQLNHARYARCAAAYVAVFAASSVVGVLAQFAQDRLALVWRESLTTQLVERYAHPRGRHHVAERRDIDNPDQRISEDVRSYTSLLLSFLTMLVNASLTTIAFSGVLWSVSPVLFVVAAAYAAIGSGAATLLGHRLIGLNNLQLKREADFRHGLVRARDEGAASVDTLTSQLGRTIANARAMIRVTRNMNFFTSGYNYLVQLIPVLIVAPRYMRGEVELGVVTQSAMAFAQLLGAFSLVVAQFPSIATFSAAGRRLGRLWIELERALA